MYVSTHNHTVFSTLDGLARIEDLVARAVEYGMPAMAITDHRTVGGHVKFYKACREAGIKPLLGVEINETDDRTIHSRKEREARGFDDYHLVLLARDNDGYRSLLELMSDAATTGYFDKTAQTDMTILSRLSRGLIATSACVAGRIPRLILADRIDEAVEWAGRFRELFDQFYLEVQPNSMPEQAVVNRALLEISRKTGIPLILGVDVHYLDSRDADVQDILLCIQTGKRLSDENRMRFSGGPDYYLWHPDDIDRWLVSSGLPREVVDNTLLVAEACDVSLDLGTPRMPVFETPDGSSPEEYLRAICEAELNRRFASHPDYNTYAERLKTELDVIIPRGFASYFLILKDILDYCERERIPRGGGRGSAAGSLVAYLTGITTIDPIEHGLIFERFLNPERASMPDIDVDISHEHRDQVIAYVRQKYGNVAQIATYTQLHAKSIVKDICRVYDVPYKTAEQITSALPDKMPDQSDVTLDKLFLAVNDFDAAVEKWGRQDASRLKAKMEYVLEGLRTAFGDRYEQVMYAIERLEGVVRSTGIHAGGVLIAPSPLTDYCAVSYPSNKKGTSGEILVSSVDMDDVDAYGLLKIDLLGLKTVSVLYQAAEMAGIDPVSIPLDDPAVYRLYQEGRTHGVFQVARDGITHYIKQVRPVRFSDLVDILALYRPGPLDAVTETGRTIADQYVYNRTHPESIVPPHPDLADIYRDTYGVMIYQEQLMAICRKLAGYTLGGADTFRRIVGKKKIDEVERLRQEFIYGSDRVPGGLALGYSEDFLNMIFDQIKAFAGYAFNKSHSAAYAYLSYQTAYMKVHYPVEYMCALLSSETDDADKTMHNTQECRRLGIPILPVDCNSSDVWFKVQPLADGTRGIRYGLMGVKGIGPAAAHEVVKWRPYESLRDFVTRVEGRRLHKKVMHTFILAGLFDSFNPNRFEVLREYMYDIRGFDPAEVRFYYDLAQKDFVGEKRHADCIDCCDPAQWNEAVCHKLNLHFYGFILSGHPAENLPNHCWSSQEYDRNFYISGILMRVNEFKDKAGRDMAKLVIDTPFGECTLHVFFRAWARYKNLVHAALDSPDLGSRMLTFKVKRQKFMNTDTVVLEAAYPTEEGMAMWQSYLDDCLTPAPAAYSRYRFYA